MPRRPLTLFDTMMLVGATATGLTVARALLLDFDPYRLVNHPFFQPVFWTLPLQVGLTPHAICWSLALIVLRLRPPRPRPRRVFLQPGMAASLCVTSWLAAWEIGLNAFYLFGRLNFHSDQRWYLTLMFSLTVGPTVGTIWLILALSGRWRAERSWIDGLGRALGVYWLLSVPINLTVLAAL